MISTRRQTSSTWPPTGTCPTRSTWTTRSCTTTEGTGKGCSARVPFHQHTGPAVAWVLSTPACTPPKRGLFSPFQQLLLHSCHFPVCLCLQGEDASRVGCSAAGCGQETGDVRDSPAPRQRRRGDADQPGCDTHGGAGPAGKLGAQGGLCEDITSCSQPSPLTCSKPSQILQSKLTLANLGQGGDALGYHPGLSPSTSASTGCTQLCLPELWQRPAGPCHCRHSRVSTTGYTAASHAFTV